MSAITRQDETAIESVVIKGDLSGLSASEKATYMVRVCESLGLNPLTHPLAFMNLNGKTVLYAKRDAADQLRRRDRVSVRITNRERVDDLCVVTANATMPDGRCDESIGAVSTAGLRGEALANALLKAETKAKRRVTLSICGLGMLSEDDLESIPRLTEGEIEAKLLNEEARENHTAVSEAQARKLNEDCALADSFAEMLPGLASDEDVARWCEFNGAAFRELHDSPRQKLWRVMTKRFGDLGVKPNIAKAWINQAPKDVELEQNEGSEP